MLNNKNLNEQGNLSADFRINDRIVQEFTATEILHGLKDRDTRVLDFIYDNVGTVSIIVLNYVVIPFVLCTAFWFWTGFKYKFSVGVMIWIPVILINRILDFVWEPFLWLMASAVISLCVLKIMEWLMATRIQKRNL